MPPLELLVAAIIAGRADLLRVAGWNDFGGGVWDFAGARAARRASAR
ncbi:MAG: hypothetical protein U0Z44_16135 [Kouleothrix sp.]